MALTSVVDETEVETLFGFPLNVTVEPQPRIFVSAPNEAFSSSKVDIALEGESEEILSGITVTAKSSDGKEFPVDAHSQYECLFSP